MRKQSYTPLHFAMTGYAQNAWYMECTPSNLHNQFSSPGLSGGCLLLVLEMLKPLIK